MHIHLHSNTLNGDVASNELGITTKIYKSSQMFFMQKHFLWKKKKICSKLKGTSSLS